MAKKEQARGYMQAYIPQGGKSKYVSEMAFFNGLDLRDVSDSSYMTDCVNIDVTRLPEIVSVDVPNRVITLNYGSIMGAYGCEKALFAVCEDETGARLIKFENGTETVSASWANNNLGEKREMAVFCYYPITVQKMAYQTIPEYKLLIYPDRKYIDVGFKSGDAVNVIAPVMAYDDSTAVSHELEFSVPASMIDLETTIYKDGTVQIESESKIESEFEGLNVKATFIDVNKNVYSGSVGIKGKIIGTETYGIFLKKVSGSTATLQFKGAKPSAKVESVFYVTNDTSGDIVYSEDVTIEAGNAYEKEFTVKNLSKSANYYAYFDYNLSGNNTVRYELYFTLSDETTDGSLKIDGKLIDDNGSLLKLDVAKEYAVAYEVTNGTDEVYEPSNNGSFGIKLGAHEDESGDSISPEFQHITVWNSRLFGMKDSVVVCSSAGTPFDWTLDSPEADGGNGLITGGYDESHSWYSTTQANTKASGKVTAITSYDGHPVIFKDDFMHQVYGTKNPFRIQDIVSVGCVSARSICELDSVLYFASGDGIYRYSGGYPSKISDALNTSNFDENVVCGGYDGVLYVYNRDLDETRIYTYCPANGMWSSIKNPHGSDAILLFALNDDGLYSVGEDGKIFAYPKSTENGGESEWSFKTSPILHGSADDKRIHSVSLVADGDDINLKITHDSTQKGDLGNYVEIKEDSLYGIDKLRALIRKTDSLFHRIKASGKGVIRIRRIDVTYSRSGKRYR